MKGYLLAKSPILFLILISMFPLMGCWDYRDIEHLAIVSGVAIDYNTEQDGLLITVEIIVPTTEQGKSIMESEIFQGYGKNYFDAVRNLISKTGRKLYWGHAKVIIFSKELFKREDLFIGVLDWFERDAETREDIWILVSREKNAGEIFLGSNTKLQKIKSLYLNDILINEKSISKYGALQLWEFIDSIGAKGKCIAVPTVFIEYEHGKDEEKTKIPTIYGSEIVDTLKPLGRLDGNETKALLLIQDELKGGLFVIEKEGIKVSLEIFDSKTKMTPKVSVDDKEITMEITNKLSVNLGEIVGDEDFIEESKRMELEEEAGRQIGESMKKLIHLVQNEYKCDALGFDKVIEIKAPDKWKELEDSWNEIFPRVNCKVEVDVTIRGSSLRSEPIKVKE